MDETLRSRLRETVEAASLRRRQQLDHLRRFAAEADRELSQPQRPSAPSMLRSTQTTEPQPMRPPDDPPWVRKRWR